jgi:hypothetical protein
MWKAKPKPHYGAAYPPKPFRWRRWLVVAAIVGWTIWYHGHNEFVVVEIDDGSAPAVGQYTPDRRINGWGSTPISEFPIAASPKRRIILHAPFETWRDSIRIHWERWDKEPAPAPVEFRRDFWLPYRCVVVIRWNEGQATAQGCARIPGEGGRRDPNDPLSPPLW